MNRFENLELDSTEFKIIREQSKKRRRRPQKAHHTISKREKAALKKWEMEIIKEYEKANEKIKRKKSCKKQPLIKTLYAIKKPKTSRRKRRSSKTGTEEKSESSQEPVAVPVPVPEVAETPEPTVSPTPEVEVEVAANETPAQSEETVSKPVEETPENKTVLSSMAETLGLSASSPEEKEPKTAEPKTGGKRRGSRRNKNKKGGK